MSKGLKGMIADALKPERKPVEVSAEAHQALANKMREWSGWDEAGLVLGPTQHSKFAECDHNSKVFTANIDNLSINPNRVLLTVTPYRLKQEAVLTGALLHEAGHARHSHWRPRDDESRGAWTHSDGEPVAVATEMFAMLCEEARIEGLMAQECDRIGAAGLAWTMRASAAHTIPMTTLSAEKDQQLMDLISSYVLRAGRERAFYMADIGHGLPGWVQQFTELVKDTIEAYLISLDVPDADADADAHTIVTLIHDMVALATADRGTYMIDTARHILTLLFPETSPDEAPQVEVGCGGGAKDKSDDSDDKSDDEAEDSESSAGETDEDEPEPEDDESEDGESGESGDDEPEDESDGEGDEPDEELAEALEQLEQAAKAGAEEDASEQMPDDEALTESGGGAGGAGKAYSEGGWRYPNKEELGVAKAAEQFLRDLIAPSESSKVLITDSPSAMVDGAALAAWRAGNHGDPRFFKRIKRTVADNPPVKVAVLVDVSGSMDSLQEPSAILSWALASAALDLRNFAGRGQNVESCLIHWGSSARVIAKNGQTIPGIKEFSCFEGTTAMDAALDLVEDEMPGFFDHPERPEHRLIVQFTDWQLMPFTYHMIERGVARALAAGVNMLTIAPPAYNEHGSDLPRILAQCTEQRGKTALMKYNPGQPDQVWAEAARALS